MSTKRPIAALHALAIAMASLTWLASSGHAAEGAPESVVPRESLAMRNGVLLREGRPFTGYAITRERGSIVARVPYREGREHGRAFAWYENGARRHEKVYVDGRREGEHRGYWPNGSLQFVYRYENDRFEGEQVAYFPNGRRLELRHYVHGAEEGRQQFWSAEGRLIANYVFRNGRRYGIVGRHDCVTVRSD